MRPFELQVALGKSEGGHLLSVALCLLGSAGLVVLAYVCQLLAVDFTAAAFLILICVVVLSIPGSYASSVLLSVVAAASLAYFLAPPVFSFRVEREDNVAALCAFLATSITITALATKVRTMSDEKLQRSRAELARYARVATLSELSASIVHEVNQPLAGIVSSGVACRRWLANQPPNIERANHSLERIIRDAERASSVIERVRGLVKNTAPKKAAVNVPEAVREVIALTDLEVRHNQIQFVAELSDNLPKVWADRIQLQQVCLNLIVNSIESMKELPQGPRDLTLRAERDSSGGLLLTVADTGAGFDPKNKDNMFNAFFTTKADGMGMGLAISRSIVEAHGGRMWFSENAPRGAKIQFTLPAPLEPEAAA